MSVDMVDWVDVSMAAQNTIVKVGESRKASRS